MSMWSLIRSSWCIVIYLPVMISSNHLAKDCCGKNYIVGEKPVCIDGSTLSLKCYNSTYVLLYETFDYTIKDGHLVVGSSYFDMEYIIPPEEFCVGVHKDEDPPANVAAVCLNTTLFDEEHINHEERHLYNSLYSYFLLVSVFFLGATFAVYCGIPELWDLGGKCLICFVFSLALGYLSLFALQQNYINYYETSRWLCTAFGFWTYFWLLSSFTWLSLISFNIWYQSKYIIRHVSDKNLWLLYLAFGFGVPVAYQAGAVISHHLPSILLTPSIGNGVCWFQGKTEVWVYFSGPMAIFLFFNVLFFFSTTRLLWVHYKEARPQTRIRRLRSKTSLYLKLFLAMGLTWIFELASFAFSLDLYVADVLNSLQGPIIFILMVLTRRRVVRSLTCSNSFVTNICLPCAKIWSEQDTDDEVTTEGSADIALR